jgi:DNA-binding CsgD family transcriptional regulator
MSTQAHSSDVPPWVEGLDLPVWVRNSGGSVSYMNDQAAELLGRDRDQCIGLPCHAVVAGRTDEGQPFCRANCSVAKSASEGRRIGLTDMIVPGPKLWGMHVRVIIIPMYGQNGATLVHCAFKRESEHRALNYLRTILRRNPLSDNTLRKPLTRREKEVLALLANDETLYAIADDLKLSYSTVRNHVQHILAKLNVHSITEAVAAFLTAPPSGSSKRSDSRNRRA